ncbi:hypothetical protein Tco_0769522 [Tanacetum coccineum]|uniref:Uncharacterized protein n=1 Tax=Tanacetum coccineum TaxID=301880 RepID=A0ABQ4ZAW5_9ASTR
MGEVKGKNPLEMKKLGEDAPNREDNAIDFMKHYPALACLKSVKPKVKANVVEESSVPVSAASTKVSAATTTTTATILTPRKGIVITELETAEVDDDQEATKIKELMKIIPDEEEVAIDAIPLATKLPTL